MLHLKSDFLRLVTLLIVCIKIHHEKTKGHLQNSCFPVRENGLCICQPVKKVKSRITTKETKNDWTPVFAETYFAWQKN